jgi:diguanylate cyclase (GGDEF)-like protein/PAS domain S-box-containing protein
MHKTWIRSDGAITGSGTETGMHGASATVAPVHDGIAPQPDYQELFNGLADATCILDGNGRFLDINDTAAAMYGRPREFFVGRSCEAVLPATMQDRPAMLRCFRKALAGIPQSLEFRGELDDRGQIHLDLHLTPTSYLGQPALIVVLKDVTRWKQAEQQVQRLNRLYAVLNATNEFILRCHDARTLFAEACRIAVEVGGFRMSWIGLIDAESGEIRDVAHSGMVGDYLEHLHIVSHDTDRGNGPTGKALREGIFQVCNDIVNDPHMAPWHEQATRMGYRASAAFPLRVAEELKGALSLYSDTTGFFDIEEIGLLDRLSQNIGFALDNIAAENRRQAAEEMLRIKERALSTSINGIVMASLDGTLSYVNRAFLDLWGYQDESDVLGRPMQEFSEPPDQVNEIVNELHTRGFSRCDLIARRKDGTTFVAQLSANMVTDAWGKPLCMQGALIDITERRAAEELMQWDREQQTTLRGMLEVVLQGGPMETTLDYCLRQLLSVSWLSILPKGGIFLMDEGLQTLRLTVSHNISNELMSACARVPLGTCHCGRAAATRQMQFSQCVDERHDITFPGMEDHGHYNMPLISDGEVLGVMVLYLSCGFRRDQRKEQFLSSVTDILAAFVRRKRDEDSLRLAAAVIQSTHDGVVVTDLEHRILRTNPSFSIITGYSEDEAFGNTPRLLQSQRHDAAFYQQMWNSIEECGFWQGEIWNRRKDGELYPEWLTVSAVRDEKGVAVNYVGVFSDISKVKQAEQKLQHLAHYDALTELPNRLLLRSRLEHAIEQAQRANHLLAVLFLDLDRFKDINDSLGHPAGDELLQIIAKRLRTRLRKSDTLARIGGDEFVVLLESPTDVRDVVSIAQMLIRLIREPVDLSCGREVYVGVSIGISIYPDDGDDAEQLIRNADTAMYQVKEHGSDNFHLYTESMTRRIEARLEMEARLRRAVTNHEFTIHYQPLVSVADLRCTGLEALVRWNDPQEEELVMPGKFIPLAEETGLILPLGDWVLHTACHQMKAWRDSGLALETLAINLSPIQFKQPDIHSRIAACLAGSGLPASCLELEITESAIMEQGPDAVAKLAELKQLGVRLAIDDFGTGYSSLSYLKDFPIDKLKIDQSFVREIATSPAAAEIVAIIIGMARTLNLESLAEGVELEEQLQFLQASGCDSCQGYFFSRPVPVDSVQEILGCGSKGLALKPGN